MARKSLFMRTGVCALVLAGLAGLAQAAFKEVAYIESTGAQWINTHYEPTCTDTFEMKVQLREVSRTGRWLVLGDIDKTGQIEIVSLTER